jgi:hypothetical protein
MKCAYVEDLYPLYLEGLVSEETKKDIEQHLEECAACREKLLAPTPEIKAEEVLTDSESTEVQKKAVRRYKKNFFGIIATAVVLALFVGGAGVFSYNYYEQHPHTVYSVNVPDKFSKINFNNLSNSIFGKSKIFKGILTAPSLGVIVEVKADGTIRNIECNFLSQNNHLDTGYQTSFTTGNSQTHNLKIIQKYSGTDNNTIGGRNPQNVLAEYSKLPIEHILDNIGISNYKWLNLAYSDEVMGSMHANVNGMDQIVSIGVTPSAQLKCYMIKRDGTIQQLGKQTIVDSRKYMVVYVSANMNGNLNIDEHMIFGALLAYVIEI